MSEQQQGREWEKEIADEFGLTLVPGSGAPWHSKLDITGQGARWSLKWTSKDSYRVTKEDLEEAIDATRGMGGTGEIPFWAFHIAGQDFVMMRKDDFKSYQQGDLVVIPEKRTKTAIRARLSDIPILLREEE